MSVSVSMNRYPQRYFDVQEEPRDHRDPHRHPRACDRTYLAHDGKVALVVDPQRDYDRVLDVAREAGVRITHVFETHIHNDYVTGGLALAQEVGAAYHVNADDPVDFERTGVSDGDVLEVGDTMRVSASHTPGHTHTHLSYALEAEGRPVAVFTGASLLFGSTGARTCSVRTTPTRWSARSGTPPTGSPTSCSRTPRSSPRTWFGSFCSARSPRADSSTIGQEKWSNPVLTRASKSM